MRYVIKVQAKAAKFMQPPKAIVQYVRGFGSLPSAKDASVKKYKAWLETQLTAKTYKVYRAFVYGDKVKKGDDIFSDDPLSFTESKETALSIAEQRHEDQPDDYAYVVEITAPADRIYFHHTHGGELGKEHSKEKEVMVSARHMDFKILKTYKPDTAEASVRPKEADAGKNGDWKKEGYTVKHIETIGTYHRFGAFLKGKMVGELAVDSEGKDLFVEGTQIDDKHRRKGLATALYELAEKRLKKKILNLDYKSDDSKKFWKQPGRKFGTEPTSLKKKVS